MLLFRGAGVEVFALTEREGPQRRPEELFPRFDRYLAANVLARMPLSAFAPATGRLMHTYQSFLLRLNQQVILIDTCVGDNKARPPHFGYPKFDWPRTFKQTGITFEDVDHVICTHLHVDHVGWNTVLQDGKWVPTFPNATYWFGEEECACWEAQVKAGDDLAGRIWTDSVLPVIAADRARLVPMNHRFSEAIRFVGAPGHTPGMFRVDVDIPDGKLIFATDIMHQPLQVRLPEWSTVFCTDGELAVRTRKAFLEEVADSGAILFPEHFAFPVAGRIVSVADGGYAYQYLDGQVL